MTSGPIKLSQLCDAFLCSLMDYVNDELVSWASSLDGIIELSTDLDLHIWSWKIQVSFGFANMTCVLIGLQLLFSAGADFDT